MATNLRATHDCRMVGEYVEEAECPVGLVFREGEVVRPQVIANYVDIWGNVGLREFTVLLKDGRVLAIHGSGLKHLPHPVAGQDVYSVVIRTQHEESIVALFKTAEVAGIFHGEIRLDRKIA